MPLQLGRRIRHQAPFLTVLAVLAAAVIYLLVEPMHWRRASVIIAVSMLLAAGLRVVLSEAAAGMLKVRGRWRDITAYLLLGVVVLVVSIQLG